LQRRTAAVVLCFICIATAALTLLSPLASIGRYLYSNPIFDPVASALLAALPWLFLAALLPHPHVRESFGEPIKIRFSVRTLLIAAAIHVALFVAVQAVLPWHVSEVVETLLLLPARLLVGAVIHLGAWSALSENALYSMAGPLFEILWSALAWGCLVALVWARVRQSAHDTTI
jgi:hypothetical protein